MPAIRRGAAAQACELIWIGAGLAKTFTRCRKMACLFGRIGLRGSGLSAGERAGPHSWRMTRGLCLSVAPFLAQASLIFSALEHFES